MKFELIQNIQDSVNSFENTDFYSLAEDKTVLIKNKNTEAVYAIKYEEEDGNLIFDTTGAEVIKEKKQSQQEKFQTHVDDLKLTIGSLFKEDFDGSVEKLKELVKNVPNIDPSSFTKEKPKGKYEEVIANLHPKSRLVKSIQNYSEAEKQFESSFKLFEEEGNLVEKKVVDPRLTKKLYNEKQEIRKQFTESIDTIVKFHQEISDYYSEDVAKVINGAIDITKPKTSIPKVLVLAKNRADAELNIIEESETIKNIYESAFGDKQVSFMEGEKGYAVPVVYNRLQEKPKFLKFREGVFSTEDLSVLEQELERALGRYGDLDEEEFKLINEMKTQVDYMQTIDQIDDQLVMNIITEFNKRFALGGTRDYKNPEMQRGWKSAGEPKSHDATPDMTQQVSGPEQIEEGWEFGPKAGSLKPNKKTIKSGSTQSAGMHAGGPKKTVNP